MLELPQNTVVERRYPGSGDVRAIELGDVSAVADDAHSVADIGLQIDVWRRGNERQHLAMFVNESKLGRARSP